MRLHLQILAALLITAGAAPGDPVPQGLEVSNDGSVRFKPALGETNWTGSVGVEHRGFHLAVQGSVSTFSGPAIRRTTAPGTTLRREDLVVDFEWISLVAIGEIKVTVIGPDGAEEPVNARRFVYLPKDDRILIDGIPWSGGPPRGGCSR